MRLSIKTCTLDMPFEAMLDFCVAQGVQAVEIGTGNWSGAPHIDLDELLGSETARQRWMDQLRRRNIALCALNCSGNPLAFQKDWEVTEKTFRLAKLLGVEKIVMMSGLPPLRVKTYLQNRLCKVLPHILLVQEMNRLVTK